MEPADRRRFLMLLATTGLATAAGGCDALTGLAVPELPLWVNRPGGALSVAFRKQLSDKNKVKDLAYERGKPAIDVGHMRVFVPSQDGGLYAVDARNGDVIYRFATLGPVQSEPLYDPVEDVLYFGSGDGALYKIRAKDGELLFRFMSNSEVARKPVLDGGVLFFVNANDTLVAIDKKTGKLKFYQHRTPAFGIEIGGYAGCAVGHGKVFTAFSDGSVMAYSTKDGAEQWPNVDLTLDAQSADGEAPQYLDADTTPILARVGKTDGVIVAHFDGGVYALEVESGRVLWRNERAVGTSNLLLWEQPAHEGRTQIGGEPGPDAPARRLLIAASGRTGLWGIDVDTGISVWQKKLPEGGISAPVEVSGAVMVSTTRYGVFLVEPTRGGVIDGIEPGNEIAMTPAAYGRHAFVMTNGGELLGLVVHPPPAVP
jgi:outer membrane protein assembly factor BamB